MSGSSKFSETTFRRGVLAGGLCALVLLGAPLSAAAETVTVHMKTNNTYDPKSKTVKAGDTVEWVNDGGSHTATPDPGQPDPFQSSPILTAGQKYSVVISGSPRTIKYHCQIHGAAMTGEIVVSP